MHSIRSVSPTWDRGLLIAQIFDKMFKVGSRSLTEMNLSLLEILDGNELGRLGMMDLKAMGWLENVVGLRLDFKWISIG